MRGGHQETTRLVRKKGGGLKSVRDGEKLNESQFSADGGCCVSGTAWLIILSQEGD